MARHASRATLVSLLLAVASSSCVLAPRSIDVREVREFPEYGGWLPVDSKGHVVPEHVVRVEEQEGRVVCRVPATREEALERVSKERQRGAVLPVHGAFLLAASPLILAADFVVKLAGPFPDSGSA